MLSIRWLHTLALLVAALLTDAAGAQAEPEPRALAGIAYDSARQRLVMFGGEFNNGYSADTFVHRGLGWQQLTPFTSPPARSSPAMGYDPIRDRLVVFGGFDGTTYLGDTWEYVGESWVQIAPVGTAPAGRYGARMAFDAGLGQLVLFGGLDAAGSVAETWSWNGASWNLLAPASSPSARYNHAMQRDDSRNRIVLFGGATAAGFANDTFEWYGGDWHAVSTATAPSPRAMVAFAPTEVAGTMLAFGGYGASATTFGDTWLYDGVDWTPANPTPQPPPASGAAAGYLPEFRSVVSFSGVDSTGLVAGTWLWRQQAWLTAPLTAVPAWIYVTPPERSRTALAWDSIRGRVVCFGGLSPDGPNLSDTWEITDEGEFSNRSPMTSPPPMHGHALAFDALRGVTVLFGGSVLVPAGFLLPSNQTWTWDGTTWTQQQPTTVPPARADHTLTWDPVRQVVVMYGGETPGPSGTFRFSDTWIWNGTNWQQAQPTTNPGPRSQHAAAWFVGQNEIALAGGRDSNGALVDSVYHWNGTDWVLRGNGVQSARVGAAGIQRTDGVEVVAFGNLTWDGVAWGQAFVASEPEQARVRIAPTRLIGCKNFGQQLDWVRTNGVSMLSFVTFYREPIAFRYVAFDSSEWPRPCFAESSGDVVVLQSGATSPNGPASWNGQRFRVNPSFTLFTHGTNTTYDPDADVVRFLHWQGWLTTSQGFTTLSSVAVPFAQRTRTGMCYDRSRQRLVVFGGFTTTGAPLYDTWEMDASGTWTRRYPATNPEARGDHAMVYDERRGRVVMFGGLAERNGVRVALAECYEWDGVDWLQRNVPAAIPARHGHSLVYDSRRQRVVLFGGRNYPLGVGVVYNDFWDYDGSEWTRRVFRDQPRMAGGSLAYDRRRGTYVLLGGQGPTRDHSAIRELTIPDGILGPGTLAGGGVAMDVRSGARIGQTFLPALPNYSGLALMLVTVGAAGSPLPLVGTLVCEPSQLFVANGSMLVSATNPGTFPIGIPNSAGLAGALLSLQGAVLQPGTCFRLSDAVAVTVLAN